MARHVAEGLVPSRRTEGLARSIPDLIEETAVRYLARRDRTEAQVRNYLSRQGASPARITACLARLRTLGYLNDEVYAMRWAQARLARRPMGRSRLEAELVQQGVARSTAEQAAQRAYGNLSERMLARRLLEQSGRTGTWGKQVGLLRRYGFSEETIAEVLEARANPAREFPGPVGFESW